MQVVVLYDREFYSNRSYNIFSGVVYSCSGSDSSELKIGDTATFSGNLPPVKNKDGTLLWLSVKKSTNSKKEEYFIQKVLPCDFDSLGTQLKRNHYRKLKKISEGALLFEIEDIERNLSSKTIGKILMSQNRDDVEDLFCFSSAFVSFKNKYGLESVLIDLSSGTSLYASLETYAHRVGIAKFVGDLYRISVEFDINPSLVDSIVEKYGFNIDDQLREFSYFSYAIHNLCRKSNYMYVTLDEIEKSKIYIGTDLESYLVKINDCGMGFYSTKDNIFCTISRYKMEKSLAENIQKRLRTQYKKIPLDLDRLQEKFRLTSGFDMSSSQIDALDLVNNGGFVLVTGPAGSGKSTFANMLRIYFETTGRSYKFLSTTGRASQVLAAKTGLHGDVSTIHSYLGFDGVTFSKPYITYDFYVVDEISMCDSQLAFNLLDNIPSKSRCVFLGDYRQLPPVGAGNFLKSILSYKDVQRCDLKTVFRQGEGSVILQQANNIINSNGFDRSDTGDYRTFIDTNVTEVQNYIHRFYSVAKSKNKTVVILSPFKETPLGTQALNKVIQSSIGVKSDEHFTSSTYDFYVGDRVMFTENKWTDKGGYCNGDMGVIECISVGDNGYVVVVKDSGESVRVSLREARGVLDLGYCLTIHKSQGSEFDVVCIVIGTKSNYSEFLSKNLLYTAFTRSKSKLVLFSTSEFESFMKKPPDESSNLESERTLLNYFLNSKEISYGE